MSKKIVAIHKEIENCKICEISNGEKRYFTAIICGWNSFRFFSKSPDEKSQTLFEKVIIEVKKIKKNIESLNNNLDKELKYVEKLNHIYYI